MRGGLLKLLVVTVLAAAGAWYALESRGGAGSSLSEAGELVFPELEEAVNDVSRLVLETGGETISLARSGEEWTVEEWGGYPASFETVKTTIMGVAGLERMEPKTSRPERYADLGLEDPAEGRNSLRVSLQDGAGAPLARLVVGDRRQGGGRGLYVRIGDDARTWLVDGELSPPKQASGWVSRELLRLAADRVRRVTVEHDDGEVVAIERPAEGGDYALAEVPEGHELTSPSVLRSLAGALSYLDLEAVVGPADEVPAEEDFAEARFETDDGLVVLARVARQDDQAWLRLAFEQQDPPTPPPAAEDAPEEGGAEDEGEEEAEAQDDAEVLAAQVAEEVADLTGRLSPWTFRISTWKADALLKRTDDLVRPIEEPEADPGVDPGAEGPPLDLGGLDLGDLQAFPPADPVGGQADDEAGAAPGEGGTDEGSEPDTGAPSDDEAGPDDG